MSTFDAVEDSREGDAAYQGAPPQNPVACICGHPMILHVGYKADLGWCRAGGCGCQHWRQAKEE